MNMKKSALLAFAVLSTLFLTGCRHAAPASSAESAPEEVMGVRTGDLLFVSIPIDYDIVDKSYEATAEEMNVIHVVILEVDSAMVWTTDATIAYGVDRHPLDTFLTQFSLRDGTLPRLDVMRLDDAHAEAASRAVEASRQYLGAAYDTDFSLDNDRYYCSELVQLVYTDNDGKPLFPVCDLEYTSSSGEIIPYWTQIFHLIGHDIPTGPGVMPCNQLRSPLLHPVEHSLYGNRPHI